MVYYWITLETEVAGYSGPDGDLEGAGTMAGGGLRGEKILGGCRWIFFGEEKRGTNSDEIVGRMDSWEGHRAVIHARG
jgi:hypothetical protein